jgi:hypothetical protein
MGRVIKGAFLGSMVGGAVVALQSRQRAERNRQADVGPPGDTPPTPLTEQAVPPIWQPIVGAAAAGATVGFFLDRRARRVAKRAALAAPAVVQYARRVAPLAERAIEGLTTAAEHARPHVRHAAEVALKKAEEAAEAAADAARPQLQKASKEARKRAEPLFERAEPLFEAAKPKVEHAAHVARERAADLAEAASRHLAVESNGHGAPKQIVVTLA